MTHMRRQIREALVASLEGIEGTRVLMTHRVGVAAALAATGTIGIIVYPVADPKPERVSNSIQGRRPTWRGFAYGVAIIGSDEDAEDGTIDAVSVEVERRVFNDAGIRALATRDVSHEGGEVSILPDAGVAIVTVYEFQSPMTEGAADRLS